MPNAGPVEKRQVRADEHCLTRRATVAARETESELGLVLDDRRALQASGRRLLGVVGRTEKLPFAAAIRVVGGWKPAIVLWTLAFIDALVTGSMLAVRSDAHIAVAGGALGPLEPLRFILFGLGGVLALWLEGRSVTRVSVARGGALAAAAGTAGVAVSTSSLSIFVSAVVAVLALGALATVVLPMLFDYYRPELRVAIAAGYGAATVGGLGVAAGALAVLEGVGLSWRVDLLMVAGAAVAGAVVGLTIGEPRSGAADHGRMTQLVDRMLGGGGLGAPTTGPEDSPLTIGQRFRRTLAPSAVPSLLSAAGVFGLLAWSLSQPVGVLVRDRYGLVSSQRSLLLSLLWFVSVPMVVWHASRGATAFRKSPRELIQRMQVSALWVALGLACAPVAPDFALTFTFLAVACALAGTLLANAAFLVLTLADPDNRSHAALLVGIAAIVGAAIGTQVINTIGTRFGVEWALVAAALLPISAAALLGRSALTVENDLDSLVGRTVEAAELSTRKALGHHLPLLGCRHINFSYGQVQVLFDVSLTVDEGEMIALLGTNGAGKSTLLRLVSGLELPASGSIHYRGADITFLGSDRRVAVGISQIPGGRAVFGPATVLDNLRAYGYSLGRDRTRLETRIEEVFDVLPQLAERRLQLASTLSGGERQMLALAKTYLIRPRLLVIDELSLGLAPILVGQLLDMVRQVNAGGTAVILVEQSVNVALSVVDHAYFMEKGEMRFDGPADALLDRPDLLRSVFLKGATDGLKAASR